MMISSADHHDDDIDVFQTCEGESDEKGWP